MIQVEQLHVRAGEFQLRDISFEVPSHHYVVLMGPTGSGKTTVMESICGLRTVISGKIVLQGHDVTHCKPAARGIGLVPQDRALFPTMTVQRQIELPVTIRGWTSERRRARITELARLLDIQKLLDRKPQGLSGGESQRVALARALSFEPQVLLLDEPLSALDVATRRQMVELLQRVHQHTRATVLHITHNPHEADQLADAVFVLQDGKLVRS